jgi:polyphosphate glucokinase
MRKINFYKFLFKWPARARDAERMPFYAAKLWRILHKKSPAGSKHPFLSVSPLFPDLIHEKFRPNLRDLFVISDMESTGNILAIDIGGSHIKCTILNPKGEWQMDYKRVDTPIAAKPSDVISTIKELVKGMPDYEKISVGFPGYVRNGIIYTAPNLGNLNWKNIDLGQQISDMLQRPVRLVNDADQLGLGVVSGKGYEVAVTLGTGFGTAFLIDGYLLPHMELAHHPIHKDMDYDEYVGAKELKEEGKEKWNKRMSRVLEVLKIVFNYDRLYIGGGSSEKLTIPLEENMHLFTNKDGIKGGAKLWELEDKYHISTNYPKGWMGRR